MMELVDQEEEKPKKRDFCIKARLGRKFLKEKKQKKNNSCQSAES